MSGRLETEIRRLHAFLDAWLSGRMPADERVFQTDFADRLSERFLMIQPGGSRSGKTETIVAIRNGYGKSPKFRIAIHKVQDVAPAGQPEILVAFYEEHQTGALNSGWDNIRLSTVLFEEDRDGRLLWRHLQETWASGSQP